MYLSVLSIKWTRNSIFSPFVAMSRDFLNWCSWKPRRVDVIPKYLKELLVVNWSIVWVLSVSEDFIVIG